MILINIGDVQRISIFTETRCGFQSFSCPMLWSIQQFHIFHLCDARQMAAYNSRSFFPSFLSSMENFSWRYDLNFSFINLIKGLAFFISVLLLVGTAVYVTFPIAGTIVFGIQVFFIFFVFLFFSGISKVLSSSRI